MPQRIEIINNWNLRKLFDQMEQGNIKIPRFQRGYVWERNKVVKLLNSIYEQFPIGSLFLWEADSQFAHFNREIPELGLPAEPESGRYQFILDGQQRTTSLFVALRNRTIRTINYGAICFNLESCEFKIPRLLSDRHNEPAWKLMDTTAYSEVLRRYVLFDAENNTDYASAWENCRQRFSDYPISIIKSSNMHLDEVVDIFERINQGGKRLSLFDLVHAGAWATDFDLRDKVDEFNQELPMRVYGALDSEVFTQSLALNIFNDCLQGSQLKLTADLGRQHWPQTAECIRRAIDYLRTLGVANYSFLPYNSQLSVIQHYFYYSGRSSVRAEHVSLLNEWFWTSTFSQRFSSSSLSRMKDDAEWVRSLLAGSAKPNTFPVTLTVSDLIRVKMKNASVIKNGVLCLMALQKPRDFHNGKPVNLEQTQVSRSNSQQNHHLFPYSRRQELGINDQDIHSVVNFALISGALNREISNKKPSQYMLGYADETGAEAFIADSKAESGFMNYLGSHFIDRKAYNALLRDEYPAFVQARGEQILEAVKQRAGNAYARTTPDQTVLEEMPVDETEDVVITD